ncbi:glycerate kinase [Natrialbaceae archaeon A-arb3/5]
MIDNRTQIGGEPDRELALDCLVAGIEAAEPETVIPNSIAIEGETLRIEDEAYDLGAHSRLVVIGGGNAAAAVASALEDVLGDRLDEGVVVTDNPVGTDRVEVLPSDHPVPSQRGVESTQELLRVADDASADDLVLAIITGGGSAVLPAPAAGIDLEDLKATTEALLASGATIHEINAVRKHLSAIKGGRLADALAPATVAGIVFSDVVGNDLEVIASGPLAPDSSTYEDAQHVLERYDVDVPDAVTTRLDRGAAGEVSETPTTDSSVFETVRQHVLADGNTALAAAASVVAEGGYEPLILSSRVRGESREAAKTMAAIAEEIAATGTPQEPPTALLSGGETTVTIRGDGTGGPNQEFTLSAALELTAPEVTVASVDTDGIDGNSGAAGGIATPESIPADSAAQAALDDNDAGGFLDDHDGLIMTGATSTNVNDLRVVLVPNRE